MVGVFLWKQTGSRKVVIYLSIQNKVLSCVVKSLHLYGLHVHHVISNFKFLIFIITLFKQVICGAAISAPVYHLLTTCRCKEILLAILVSSYFKLYLLALTVFFFHSNMIICLKGMLIRILHLCDIAFHFHEHFLPTGLGISIFCYFHYRHICSDIKLRRFKRFEYLKH